MSITVGTGSAAVNYAFTVDTGSAALLLICKTPTSTANCGGNLPASRNYQLTPAHAVTGSTCSVANTGIGCLLPDQQCFISEAVSGWQQCLIPLQCVLHAMSHVWYYHGFSSVKHGTQCGILCCTVHAVHAAACCSCCCQTSSASSRRHQ
jgi:hypothetical protein